MPDERLVKQLAGIIHHHAGGCGCGDPDFGDERAADDILVLLAEQGRLVPDEATVREQWGVRQTRSTDGAVDDRPMRDREDARASLAAFAEDAAAVPVARRAWVWEPALVRRQVITTPWVAVPDGEDRDVHL